MNGRIELPGLTVRQAGERFRSGAMRPDELVAAALQRIEATEATLRAWVLVDPDAALAAARATGDELARGVDRGPLHGIPVAVKDIVDVAGWPTRCGSALLADSPPAVRDAAVVERLREAGAILLGKTVTQEFAAGVLSPPARNPWDPARSPGGSSGGSAVAVAVGAALVGVGSDTGGSIRIPAAAVGVSGFKPTFGALPTVGVQPLAPSLDTLGPLARTVDDLWLAWQVMADHRRPVPVLPSADARTLRVGVPGGFFRERLQPAVADCVASAAATLRSLGVAVVEADWADAARARAAAFVINRAETGDSIWPHTGAEWRRLDLLNPDLRSRVVGGRMIPAAAVQAARRARVAARESIARHFRAHRLDAMLTATLPGVAVPFADPVIRYPDGHLEPVGAGHTRLTMPFNATGQPVIALPAGFDADGLPIGVQLAGRPGGDESLFAVAATLERALGFAALGNSLMVGVRGI